jgi:hypothetical protein
MNITRSINKALQRLGALLTMTTLAACGGGSSDNGPGRRSYGRVGLPRHGNGNFAASPAATGQPTAGESSATSSAPARQQRRANELPR